MQVCINVCMCVCIYIYYPMCVCTYITRGEDLCALFQMYACLR